MGKSDRIFRILAATIIAILFFTGIISGTIGMVLMVLASIFVLTSFISFCPLYVLFGLKTCPIEEEQA